MLSLQTIETFQPCAIKISIILRRTEAGFIEKKLEFLPGFYPLFPAEIKIRIQRPRL